YQLRLNVPERQRLRNYNSQFSLQIGAVFFITYCVSFRCIFAQARLVAFTEFMTASSQGHMDVIFKYLSKGGNPDLNRTALHLACLEGHPPVVSMLLERGADINFPDRLGSVAMHWACRGGSLRVVQALTSHGADLNLWSTPLHVATRTGHVVIVEYLLSCGAKVNATDWEGDTALHDAVRLNRYKIVKMLILAGADVTHQNNVGLICIIIWRKDMKTPAETVPRSSPLHNARSTRQMKAQQTE
uniref:Uncharacterized protein n=1 Tax=Periophthalmus magnuspinnatus TaxID=409849 RepID=A0A3B4B646_9GOBI